MFCPQCGTESSQQLKYCRTCGANLKVIGKAVSLSAAIARSDGVPAKIKEMVQNLKIEKVTEEVSRAMDKMNREIVRSSNEPTGRKPWWLQGKTKTPEQRRERHLVSGTIRLSAWVAPVVGSTKDTLRVGLVGSGMIGGRLASAMTTGFRAGSEVPGEVEAHS